MEVLGQKKQKMYTEKDLIGKGGKFLVLTALDAGIFSREKFSEEQNMIAKSALDYATDQLKPISNQLNNVLDEVVKPNNMVITMGAGDIWRYSEKYNKHLNDKFG